MYVLNPLKLDINSTLSLKSISAQSYPTSYADTDEQLQCCRNRDEKINSGNDLHRSEHDEHNAERHVQTYISRVIWTPPTHFPRSTIFPHTHTHKHTKLHAEIKCVRWMRATPIGFLLSDELWRLERHRWCVWCFCWPMRDSLHYSGWYHSKYMRRKWYLPGKPHRRVGALWYLRPSNALCACGLGSNVLCLFVCENHTAIWFQWNSLQIHRWSLIELLRQATCICKRRI